MNFPESYFATYDAMGNLVTDSRRGLQFSYNLANLPCKAEGIATDNAGLTLNYGYLSDGTKTGAALWQMGEDSSGVALDTLMLGGVKYRGSFVYEVDEGGESERLSSIAWSEGRIAVDYSLGAANPFIRDEWHITDHLGSTRMVINLANGGSVMEKNEYLPFGTRLPSTNELAANRYRLAGKEEQRFGTGSSSLDLHLSDFGARYYDPYTARWTTRDPLAGKYPGLSPYNYCAGDPVNLIDPDGNVIKVGGNAVFKKKVYAAVNHMNSHGVGAVLEVLDSKNEVYSIVPGIQNSYYSKTRTITWNPDYMKLDETGKIMHSPTVSLAHELGHAENHAKDKIKYAIDFSTANVSFLNEEEKKCY